jgi:tetratricopeptide (TPR) repeat protein
VRHDPDVSRPFFLLIVIAAAACGPTAKPKPTLPVAAPTQTPGDDLARAQAGASSDGGATTDDPRLGTGTKPGPTNLDTIRISVVGHDAKGDPKLVAVAATQLFDQASAAHKAGKLDDAIASWRRLVTEFPDSNYAAMSLWNTAAVHEQRNDVDATVATLAELVRLYPTRREAIDAQLYIAALEAQRKRWAPARVALDAVLARTDLTYADRIEGHARRGYVILEQGELDVAEAALGDAIASWRRAPRIDDPYFIAMAFYYRGEIARRRMHAVPLRAGVTAADLRADLEKREHLAAAAYDRWKEALDFKHAYWATASGYQMSHVFVEFWRSTVEAPFPTDLDERARPDYVAEVHARVRPHLEKALDGHRMNVELGKAFGVETLWATASEQKVIEVMALLAQESRGVYVTPPTR